MVRHTSGEGVVTHAGGDLAATQDANADVHAKLLTLLAAQ